MTELRNICHHCAGTGEIVYPASGAGPEDAIECPICSGSGKLPTTLAIAELNTIFDSLVENTDAIIAEQASQRADLTAALTQIWNKVKVL